MERDNVASVGMVGSRPDLLDEHLIAGPEGRGHAVGSDADRFHDEHEKCHDEQEHRGQQRPESAQRSVPPWWAILAPPPTIADPAGGAAHGQLSTAVARSTNIDTPQIRMAFPVHCRWRAGRRQTSRAITDSSAARAARSSVPTDSTLLGFGVFG